MGTEKEGTLNNGAMLSSVPFHILLWWESNFTDRWFLYFAGKKYFLWLVNWFLQAGIYFLTIQPFLYKLSHKYRQTNMWKHCENEMISTSRAWDKKKSESPTVFKSITSQTNGELARRLEGKSMPSNMAAKSTFCLHLIKLLIVMLRCAVNVTTSFFQHFPWSLSAKFVFRKK